MKKKGLYWIMFVLKETKQINGVGRKIYPQVHTSERVTKQKKNFAALNALSS